MSELRAAAERFRKNNYGPSGGGFRIEDTITLAKGYLAQHHADDAELVDGVWLKENGAVRPMAAASATVYVLGEWSCHHNGQYPLRFEYDWKGKAYIAYVFGVPIHARPTRGDVRLLARALGVPLKETTL